MTLARRPGTVPAGPVFCLSVQTKTAILSLKAMRGSGIVKVGVTGPNLVVNTDDKTLVLFGKNVS